MAFEFNNALLCISIYSHYNALAAPKCRNDCEAISSYRGIKNTTRLNFSISNHVGLHLSILVWMHLLGSLILFIRFIFVTGWNRIFHKFRLKVAYSLWLKMTQFCVSFSRLFEANWWGNYLNKRVAHKTDDWVCGSCVRHESLLGYHLLMFLPINSTINNESYKLLI